MLNAPLLLSEIQAVFGARRKVLFNGAATAIEMQKFWLKKILKTCLLFIKLL
jgi:hypothetical protein